MTEMTPVEALFFAALAKPPPERAAYLGQVCAGDADLRQRVERLLAAHPQVGSFLETPAVGPAVGKTSPLNSCETPHAPTASPFDPSEEVGAVLAGRYQLREVIGEGGMGRVFLAQQTEPVKRLVAVKLIKAGMGSKAVLARFEAERQALALMDHPNIARVFDGGTTDNGRPYFVMELVHGVPITQYCDDHRLTPRARLELFVSVCQAIQHAHHKGIIHRDIKPSNVLVPLSDGQPVVKVIDFGVAKAISEPEGLTPRLAEQTPPTGFGTVVGTLEYMSPEQASFNPLDVDTRSDVYSLGVLLYELLTGGPPFRWQEREQAGLLEMLRVVREQEPQRPSTKLSAAEGLPTLAANRGMEPARLTRLVRGELDWIALKALEKDRNRRYETANAFALDVQRYLADEPVLACPPSAGYRFRKFARRHKRALGTAALLGALLLVVAGIFGWMARDRAAQRGRNAEAVAGLLEQCEDALRADRADRAALALGAAERRAAEGGAEDLAGRLARCQADLVLLRALDAIDTFRWTWAGNKAPDPKAVVDRRRAALADYGVTEEEGRAREAAERVNGSLVRDRLLAALDDWQGIDPSAGVRTVLRAADPDPYRDSIRDAMSARDARAVIALVSRPEALAQPARFAAVLGQLGDAPVDRRRTVLGKALLARPGDLGLLMALGWSYPMNRPQGASERVRWFQAAVAAHPENLAARNNLGSALLDQGNADGAIATFREAIRLDPKFAFAHYNLGNALHKKGDKDGAIAAYRDAIRADPKFANAHYNVAHTLLEMEDLDGALPYFKEASRLDPKDPKAPYSMGLILGRKGDPDGAIAAYREALRADPKDARSHTNLGYVLMDKGNLDGAIACFLDAIRADPNLPNPHDGLGRALRAKGAPDSIIAAYRDALRAGQPDSLTALANLAEAYQVADRFPEAIRLYEEAGRAREKKLGADHPDTLRTLNKLAVASKDAGQVAQAIRLLEEVRETQEKTLGPDHPDTLTTLHNLAVAYSAAHKWAEAIRLFEQVKESREKQLGANHPDTLRTLTNLAVAYEHDGKVAEAIRLLEQVKEIQETKLEADHPDILFTLEGLAGAYKAAGKLQQAIRLYEQVRVARERKLGADHRSTMVLLNNLAVAYWTAKQLDRSIPLFEGVLKRKEVKLGRDHPDTLMTLANLGVNYRDSGRLDEALPLLEEAYHKSQAHPPLAAYAGGALASAYIKAGKTSKATRLFRDSLAGARKSLSGSPQLAAFLAAAASEFLKLKQYAEAERLLRECLTIREKKEADAWTTFSAQSMLGEALLGQKNYADAEPLLLKGYQGMKQREARIPPQARFRLTEAAQRLVRFYEAMEQKGEAAKWRREAEIHRQAEPKEAVRLAPRSADSHVIVGKALRHRGDVDGAIASFGEAIRIDPQHGEAHLRLGALLCDAKGDYEGAIIAFREAIRIDPEQVNAHYNLGNALQGKGDLDGAIKAYREAIRLDRKHADAHHNLGYALRARGDVDGAIACFREAVRVEPKHTAAHNELAWLLATCPDAKRRDPERAVELARKAVTLAPKVGATWKTLGVALYRAGDWKAAVAALGKSLELSKGGDAVDRLFLAMAHQKLGHPDEARKWYRRAVAWLERNQDILDKDRVYADELSRFRAEAEAVLEPEVSSQRSASCRACPGGHEPPPRLLTSDL